MGGFIATQDHGDVWAWTSARVHVWVQALMKLQSLLMSMAHDTTQGREYRAAQSWPLPSLTLTLGRTGPACHWLKHPREKILHCTWAAQ